MKRSLTSLLARLSSMGNIEGVCRPLGVPAVVAIRWSMSNKTNSPPEGRLLEELFGLSESQAEMLNVVVVLVPRDDISNSLFTAVIAA